MDFTGKMALIIGDGGIGRSATLGFAAGGVRVMAVDHDEAAGEASVGVVRQQGGEALFTRADVSRAAEVQHDVQATLDAWGRIDCFFNNAGIEGKIAATPDYDDDMSDRGIAVNLRGVFVGMKHVLPVMLRQGVPAGDTVAAAENRVVDIAVHSQCDRTSHRLRRSVPSPLANRRPTGRFVHPPDDNRHRRDLAR